MNIIRNELSPQTQNRSHRVEECGKFEKDHPRGPTNRSGKKAFATWIGALVLAAVVGITASPSHAESKSVHFGVQPWPGVTVKTQVAVQLLQAMGYETKVTQLNTPITLNALKEGDVDAGFGGWYPISKSMIQPLVDQGKITRLTDNLSGAISGVAVPRYVHEAGVDSMEDLQDYADRFEYRIYGIESGSTWNTAVKNAIAENRHNLGDWEVVSSSTAAMLAEVGRSIKRQEWIAFYGWEPHWMNISYDLYYVKEPGYDDIAHTESTVYTLVRNGVPDEQPNLTRFLRQFHVSREAQSHWVYEHEFNERPEAEVAQEWISENLSTVEPWLDGVKTTQGGAAFDAVKAEYGG